MTPTLSLKKLILAHHFVSVEMNIRLSKLSWNKKLHIITFMILQGRHRGAFTSWWSQSTIWCSFLICWAFSHKVDHVINTVMVHASTMDGSRYLLWWWWNVLSLMHATFRHFTKCSDLVGVDPLKRNAADKRILPAGTSDHSTSTGVHNDDVLV